MLDSNEINEEMQRALQKFPTWPRDPHHALNIVGEEFGELTRAVLHATYESGTTDDVRKEAVQLAVVALRFAASLSQYEFKAATQEAQLCVYSVAVARLTESAEATKGLSAKTQQRACNAQESLFSANDDAQKQRLARQRALSKSVRAIFRHWQTTMEKPRAKLTPERQRLILRALVKWGYEEDTLIAAINGCARTPHNMGIRDDGTSGPVYNDIELILRDAAHIERFAETAERPEPMTLITRESKYDQQSRIAEAQFSAIFTRPDTTA